MINSELLKEAIADAKAVRATALANAKAALEEAFAPRFEAMFADKLKEESEEEEGLQEVEAPNQVSGKGGEAKGPKTKAVSKGNPKKVSDGNTNFKTVHMGQGPTDVPAADNKIDEAADEEGEEIDENFEQEEGKVEEAGLTSEDLDEIIKELENEVADEEEGQPEPVAAAPAPAPEDGEEVPAPAPEGGEGFPPAEAGVEGDEFGGAPEVGVEGEPGSEIDINLGGEEGGEGMPPAGMNAGGIPGQQPQGIPGQPPVDGTGDDDENINLEELLAALNEEAEEEEDDEKVDESAGDYKSGAGDGQYKSGGVKGYPAAPQDASKKQLKGKNHNISGQGNIGTGAVGGKPVAEATQYRVALKEAYKTIEFLRGQINEVNLLNAKLLYTNKLFKEFAGVLDDPYRMKIVESFDLTKSVREVKLAYALLAESLNFGTHMTKVPSKPVVRQASKGPVKQITEGFASKPVSSTKPSQLITEGNEMALRFKKLAGIKEAPKVISDKK